MKKKICLFAAALLLISLVMTGCGKKTPAAPDSAVMQKDVQQYITELIDENATIGYFQTSDSEGKDDLYTASCVATYASDEMKYQDEFQLTYQAVDGEWELTKCRVNTDYAMRSAETLQEAQPVEEQPEEQPEDQQEQEPDQKPDETDEQNGEDEPGQTSQNVPDDQLSSFAFALDGMTYQLPLPYRVFSELGWSVVSSTYNPQSEDDRIAANSYGSYRLTNGRVEIDAEIINMSGNIKTMRDCYIGGLTVEAKDNMDFVIAKGIDCVTTQDAVTEAFGQADSMSSSDSYASLTYEFGNYNYVKFYFSADYPTSNSITLRNFVAMPDDATETSLARPEYLDSYKAPTKLSNDVKKTQFQLDGKIYSLPCPLSEFTDAGWTIKRDGTGKLGGGNHNSYGATLEKDGYSFSVGLYNYDDLETLSTNCAVYEVELSTSYIKNAPANYVVLPGWLTLSSSRADVETMCASFEKYEGSSSVSYTYEESDYTVRIKYYFSLDEKYPSQSVTMKNTNWDY